ncbi:hypothetical protein Tco_1499674 [Tanacetum coccineum]
MQHLPPNNNYNLQPSFNQNYMQQPMPNPEDISNPTTAINMALVLMVKVSNSTILHQPTMIKEFHQTHVTGWTIMLGQIAWITKLGIMRLSVVQGIANQYRNGNVVAARAEANGKQDATYLQKQIHITQMEEAGIQITSEEFDFMATAGACEETKRVNANCTIENNLQQASPSGNQSDNAPIYESDGSIEVHEYEHCYNYEIFNLFTKED